MIAGVDNQTDISVCFQKDELKTLSKGETIAGILIRTYRPHEQGLVNVQIDTDKENLNGFGIGIDTKKYQGVREDFELDIFIGNEYFNLLQERGQIGTRHRLSNGGKIELYSDLTDFNTRMMINDFEFYRDNKDNYRKLYEEK